MGPEPRALNEWVRQRVKVDIQIAAVALTYGAETLYTDDESQTMFAEMCGLKVMHTWDLPISDAHKQGDLFEGKDDANQSDKTTQSFPPNRPRPWRGRIRRHLGSDHGQAGPDQKARAGTEA